MINIYWIDLFCGAGGTSTGIHLAGSKVIACVNHDKNAIAAHAENHPDTIHFTEDIRDFHVVEKLQVLVDGVRAQDPNAVFAIWASLECTNFSKAKGGLPRDADSRTLADHMFMYLQQLRPDYLWVENVREFMSWGPLDEKGKPESRTAGKDYVKWTQDIRAFGFRSDAKILNAANFGTYQSRERLFIQFAAKDLPIAWPEQTHTKDKRPSDLFPMERWKPVREVLDLNDEGQSIFSRKKHLSENTLKRILAGLDKFVAKGQPGYTMQYNSGSDHSRVKSFDEPVNSITTENSHAVVNSEHFIAKYFSGRPEGKVISVDGPAGSVTTVGNQAIVSATHLNSYYGNGGVHTIESACPTVTTKDRIAKVDVVFIDQQYGNSKPTSIEVPANTLTGNPKFALVNPKFIMNQYTGGGQHTSIDGPSSAVTNVPKQNLISCEPWVMNTNFSNIGKSINEPSATLTASRRHPYLVNANSSTCPPQDLDNPSPSVTSRTHLLINPSWFGHASSTDEPSCTIIARQDKAPLYLLAVENGPVAWIVFDDDCETMISIKQFMVRYCITDIKMSLLKIPELLQIQGFPKDYKLSGNQTEQKKQIGNAVEVNQAKAITKTHRKALERHFSFVAA
jgi:DNA (cytosine-5)-methyltransferase 1